MILPVFSFAKAVPGTFRTVISTPLMREHSCSAKRVPRGRRCRYSTPSCIARYASPGEALRIAKVYLLKWHDEGELPYTALVRPLPHGDSVVRSCEDWLQEHFQAIDAISQVIERAGIPERTMKRRFKAATGTTLIEYLQNLRIEQGKHLLETSQLAVDEISDAVGYADASFFRRLFKRLAGLSPSNYRRMFSLVA